MWQFHKDLLKNQHYNSYSTYLAVEDCWPAQAWNGIQDHPQEPWWEGGQRPSFDKMSLNCPRSEVMRKVVDQPRTAQEELVSGSWRQLGPQSPRTPVVTRDGNRTFSLLVYQSCLLVPHLLARFQFVCWRWKNISTIYSMIWSVPLFL